MADTVRQRLLSFRARLSGNLDGQFVRDPAGDDAVAFALEILLRSETIANVDGWRFCKIVEETAQALCAVGLMHLLPEGAAPVEVKISLDQGGLNYEVRFGVQDNKWRGMTGSKQFNSVYLYVCGDGVEKKWAWSSSQIGRVAEPGVPADRGNG